MLGLNPGVIQYFPSLADSLKAKFGKEKWVNVTRERLQFEADVSVVPGSARPKNTVGEQKVFQSILTTFGQFPQLLMSRKLTERVLQAFDVNDESLVDELQAMAKQMIQINANQAGRNQGNATGNGNGPSSSPLAGIAGIGMQ